MSIEVRPVGVTCNLRCDYCYEEKTREESGRSYRYDKEAVLAAIDKLKPGDHWSLFGGEALILNMTDLEELLKLGFDRNGKSGIQTNGSLITEAHIELFRKYKTHIGISLDGPDELNDSRWAGTEEATRAATAKTHNAIRRLCEEAKETPYLRPGLIVTLHAGNCSQERFPRFLAWLHELDDMGIMSINFHTMEMDYDAHKLFLPQEELADRLIDIWRESDKFEHVKPRFVQDVLNVLRGNNSGALCTYRACDPLNTQSCRGIDHDGSPSSCGRELKDGVMWLPAEGTGYKDSFIGFESTRYHIRQIALFQTPQELGGCQGCEYWLACQGNCSGEGEQSDWRRRSSYCATYKKLLGEGTRRLQESGQKPLPLWKIRPAMEQYLLDGWIAGRNPSLNEAHQMITKGVTACSHKKVNSDHLDHWDNKASS